MGNITRTFQDSKDVIISYIALSASVSVSTSTILGAAGVADARFLEARFFFLPEERRRFGVLERRDDLLREADLLFDRRFGVLDRRERRDELLDRAERDFDRLGAFGVLDRLADFLFDDFLFDDISDDFFDDFFDDLGVRARLLRFLDRREREELRVDALDFVRRFGDFGVLARRDLLFFDDFLDADLEVLDAEEARLEPLLGAFGVLDRLDADFLPDFLDDFFDDFGVRARLLRELRFFVERRREREALLVDALDIERLGDFGVLARRLLLFFDDFLEADLEVEAEEARLEPLGARARRAARRAPPRAALLRRLLLGALGVLARRADTRLDFREDLLAELLLLFFDDFVDFELRRLLLERLAFLIFLSSLPLLRDRLLLALIPMSLLRLETISALYASRSETNFL